MALIARWFGRPTPEAVVKEYGPAVMRRLRRLFGPRADISDVYQAVFLEVIRALPTFRGESALGTWIHRIATNVAYQEMRLSCRERARRDPEAFDPELHPAQSSENHWAQGRSVHRLYAALEALDPKKRVVVSLHDIEGYTLKEIGETLGRPLQTVASQLKVGRAELVTHFAGETAVGGRHESAL